MELNLKSVNAVCYRYICHYCGKVLWNRRGLSLKKEEIVWMLSVIMTV